VNGLIVNILVGIDILAPEGIIIDIANETLTFIIYIGIKVSIIVKVKGAKVEAKVLIAKKIVILLKSTIIIPIRIKKGAILPDRRDLLFKP